jgi:hypothetical protein
MMRFAFLLALIVECSLSIAPEADAAVFRYKSEADYYAALNDLGLATVREGFESTAWDDARSPSLNDRQMVASKLAQGILWEPASKDIWGSQFSNRDHGLTTNHNWASEGDWGLFEDHRGEAYPTTIRISSENLMYGVGGWFNTNPDLQSVGFLFEDRTVADAVGYFLPGLGVMYPGDNPAVGHEFVGIIDTDGFNSVVLTGTLEINEEGRLEGGTIFGADNFTFAVAAIPEPTTSPLLLAALIAHGASRRRQRRNAWLG